MSALRFTMNAEEGAVRRGLTYELIDHYLGRPHVDWVARYKTLLDTMLSGAKAAVENKAAAPAKVGPSLPLDRYAGQFGDPWYGRMTIRRVGSGLGIDFIDTPRMSRAADPLSVRYVHRPLYRPQHRAGLCHLRAGRGG